MYTASFFMLPWVTHSAILWCSRLRAPAIFLVVDALRGDN